MTTIPLLNLITTAMDLHGADGLYNADGPCGCGRNDLNPGECLSVDCVLANSKVVTADDEVDDYIEIGDVVYYPITITPANRAVISAQPDPALVLSSDGGDRS